MNAVPLRFCNIWATYYIPSESVDDKFLSQSLMTSSPSGPSSPRHRRIFFLVTLSFPILFLVGVELFLRGIHYGPDLSLFVKQQINGREYYFLNPDLKDRYFSKFEFNPSSSPDCFLANKPAGVFRIFCLGGSTTVGYPYWYNGAFSSFLRDRLQRIFPNRQFEVVNAGMTATNSFTVLDMAREIVDYKPDLLLVYDGHNEFYGALGIASHESLGKYRWLTETYLRLLHFRTFLLIRNALNSVSGMFAKQSSTRLPSTLMESLALGQYIPYGSPTYNACLNIFRDNLSDLREYCADAGVPVILGTQVSNLRDLAPFISLPGEGVAPEDEAEFQNMMNQGTEHFRSGDFNHAALEFAQATQHDSLRADAHYRYARALEQLGNVDAARREYVRARDLDQLRFRAGTDFNRAIRSIADNRKVFSIDMEKVFQDSSPLGLIGDSLLTEHLHPNSRGSFLIAKAYTGMMREMGLVASENRWRTADTVPDASLWKERSVTELDERIARRRTEVLTSGWPFRSQTPTVEPVAADDTLGQIVERVTRAQWSWTQAHEAAASYYVGRKEFSSAEREYRVILDQFPIEDVREYLQLASLLLEEDKLAEADSVLAASLHITPTQSAYKAMGDIAFKSNAFGDARKFYEQSLQIPSSPSLEIESRFMLAQSLYYLGDGENAVSELLKLLKIRPDYRPAILLLQKINGNH